MGAVFYGLRNGFHFVDYTLFLKRIKSYKRDENSLLLFVLIKSNRFLRVSFDSSMCDPMPKMPGVPQRSVSGPLLFIMLQKCDTDHFADDTTVHVHSKLFLMLKAVPRKQIPTS